MNDINNTIKEYDQKISEYDNQSTLLRQKIEEITSKYNQLKDQYNSDINTAKVFIIILFNIKIEQYKRFK